jgi:hypothetical protein
MILEVVCMRNPVTTMGQEMLFTQEKAWFAFGPVTAKTMCVEIDPMEFTAVTLYVVVAEPPEGVPERRPDEASRDRPPGKAGEIENEVTRPPRSTG